VSRNLGADTLSPTGINLLFGDHRRLRILALLRQRGPMTRAELSRATRIAKSSISILVNQLELDRTVQIIRATPSNRSKTVRGRPGELVEINPSSGAAIGMEFGFDRIRAVIGDVSHEILAEREIPIEPNYKPSDALKVAQEIITQLLAVTRITPSRIIGIGLGIPSPIYRPEVEGQDEFLSPQWENIDIAYELSLLTGFSTTVENSANLAAYAELLWGAGNGIEDFIYFKADNSVGGAIVINHQVITGVRGGVGEFGHLILDPNGPVCRCGQRGCLDTYASVPAMLTSATIALGYEVDFAHFLTLISKEDPASIRIITDAAEKIGQAVAALCRVMNPDAVILSGESFSFSPESFRLISETFHSWALSLNSHVKLLVGSLGSQASALGGVALILGQEN
jgi:predicted NBD/HSP70 family sugar kinase